MLAAAQAVHGVQVQDMDPYQKVSSAADLYEFANGAWLKKTKLPPDKSYIGTFDVINERNLEVLHRVAEEASHAAAPPTSPEGRVGLLYRVGMDEARADRLGVDPIRPELDRINAVKTPRDVLVEIAHLHQLGLGPGFSAGVGQDDKNVHRMLFDLGQGGLSLPDRELYLQNDLRSRTLRGALTHCFSRLLNLAGRPDGAAAAAEQTLAIETDLARVSSTPVELRDPASNYHLLTPARLAALTPGAEWSSYFRQLGIAEPKAIDVGQPKFMHGFAALLHSRPVAAWRAYLRCQFLLDTAPYLSRPLVDEQFALAKAIEGVSQLRPRWKRVIGGIDQGIGEDLGRLYVRTAFPPEAKARALVLVHNVMAALRDRIPQLDWMGAETKRQALFKLNHMNVKIGYPDRWRDYSALHLHDDSWVQNLLRTNQFEWERNLRKLGRPIDRGEWIMSPPTVNAYYNPEWNEIVFPAGILQPGFFDPQADDASNYGGIGAIIGHEMTHGFDDQGSQYDAFGERRDWWTPADKQRFMARAKAIVAQYDGYRSREGLAVNGKLTLGENIADIGGLMISHYAYLHALNGQTPPVIDGYTGEQRFFVAWAQDYQSLVSPQMAKVWISTDPHSPDDIRARGAASDNAAFYRAFDLPVPEHLPGLW